MKFLPNCETRLALDCEDSALIAVADRSYRRAFECLSGLADGVGALPHRFAAKRFCTKILRVPAARNLFLGSLCGSPARVEHGSEFADLGALRIHMDRKRLLEAVRVPQNQN